MPIVGWGGDPLPIYMSSSYELVQWYPTLDQSYTPVSLSIYNNPSSSILTAQKHSALTDERARLNNTQSLFTVKATSIAVQTRHSPRASQYRLSIITRSSTAFSSTSDDTNTATVGNL